MTKSGGVIKSGFTIIISLNKIHESPQKCRVSVYVSVYIWKTALPRGYRVHTAYTVGEEDGRGGGGCWHGYAVCCICRFVKAQFSNLISTHTHTHT